MTLASTLRSLFNPTRPRAAECLALVTDAASADEAWERLCARSLLPLEFMGSTARSFGPAARVSRPASHAAGRCRGTRCEHCVPSTWLAPRSRVPATKLAAATIASDPEAIATAESLARECAARLRVTVPRLFHWRVADRAVLARVAPSLTPFSSSGQLPWEHYDPNIPDVYGLDLSQLAELGIDDELRDDIALSVVVGTHSASAMDTALAPFAALFVSGYALLGLEGETAILGAPLIEAPCGVRGEDPEFALRLQRLLVGEQSTMWLRVRAFAVDSLDDGLLEPRMAALASIVPEAKGVRWVCVTEREWCDRLARDLAPIRRTQSDGVASAIELTVPQPRAFAAVETNERALDRALAGWSPSWSRSYAIVTDERLVTVTTCFED
ncbi:MAG: hypothetical protein U0269_26820 [Polyangiales bacterium]